MMTAQSLSYLQTLFYIVSPIVTLLAVLIAYMTLAKQARPHLLVHYRPNPDIQSFVDLVVENIGGGMARDVTFSRPIPIKYFGIEKSDGSAIEALGEGLPAIASGQRFIFDGGQYAGLYSERRVGTFFVPTRLGASPFSLLTQPRRLSAASVPAIRPNTNPFNTEVAPV